MKNLKKMPCRGLVDTAYECLTFADLQDKPKQTGDKKPMYCKCTNLFRIVQQRYF